MVTGHAGIPGIEIRDELARTLVKLINADPGMISLSLSYDKGKLKEWYKKFQTNERLSRLKNNLEHYFLERNRNKFPF